MWLIGFFFNLKFFFVVGLVNMWSLLMEGDEEGNNDKETTKAVL